jgi:protein-disulfide isomerase
MNKTDKVVFAVVAIFTIAIFGFIIFNSLKSTNVNISAQDLKSSTPNIKGNESAKVVLVEFSDFQCPACSSFYPIVKDLSERYSDSLSVVYRHFPLSIHDRAIPTARASEAAAMQGKFWDYHNMLFDNFPEYSDDQLIKYAQDAGLDVEKFKTDLNSDEVVKSVNEDLTYGESLNIPGTPTFFLIVNDQVRPVVINQYTDLENAIKAAIEEVK